MSSYSDKALDPFRKGRDLLNHLYLRGPAKCQRLLGTASAVLTQNPLLGLCGFNDAIPLSAQQMIFGYSSGLFPMDRGGKLRWQCPDPRFVLFLGDLRLSPNMRRDIRKSNFTHSFDREPRAVLDGCADGRPDTWLSERLKRLYLELFDLGAMHTVETWRDGALVGGSFGVAIGQVFTGETMFHRVPEAGKSSFAFLASHLRERGFACIDAQAWSEHMVRFGAKEVPLSDYRKVLAMGLVRSAQFRESSVREAGVCASSVRESNAPQSNAPQSNAPQSSAPQSSAPQSSVPQSSAPETRPISSRRLQEEGLTLSTRRVEPEPAR